MNGGAESQNSNCETKIKIEAPFPNVGSDENQEVFTRDLLKYIKVETVTCTNDCDLNAETVIEERTPVSGFDSLSEAEFFSKVPELESKECGTGCETDNEVEIEEQYWWLDTESTDVPFVNDVIKDDVLPPVKSSRLCIEAVSDDSSDHTYLIFSEDVDLCTSKNSLEHEQSQGDDITNISCVEKGGSEQSDKCNDGETIDTITFYLKQNNSVNEGKKSYRCDICFKSFILSSSLKRHKLTHESKKQFKCEICEKGFSYWSSLRYHKWGREGKKPYACNICKKTFTQEICLKQHSLNHDRKKKLKCAICQKVI